MFPPLCMPKSDGKQRAVDHAAVRNLATLLRELQGALTRASRVATAVWLATAQIVLASLGLTLTPLQAATQGNPWQMLGGLRQGCMRGLNALTITDAAALADGRVVVVGDFSGCGNVISPRIAIYRPASNDWEAFPNTASLPPATAITRVATSGNTIYVGGDFTSIDGVAARRIARWNGSAWSEVGGGVNGTVLALLAVGTELYAAGSFTEAGGINANGIARFDGAAWQTLGSGPSNGLTVASGATAGTTLLAVGSDVYVGGGFTQAGGVAAAGIARWSGGVFSPLGSGVAGGFQVTSLDAGNGLIYAAGDYTSIGGISANRIAAWDGSTWSRLGTETANGTNTAINSVAVLGNTVYVSGNFGQAGGLFIPRMARFSGGVWSALPGTPDGTSQRLKRFGSRLYAMGNLTQAGSLSLSYIGQFDGSAWSGLGAGSGSGFNGEVSAVLVQGTDVYVGGKFTEVNGVRVNRIARWDGSQWHALASPTKNGFNNSVETLAWYQGSLYAGGFFTNFINTVNTDFQLGGLARWDGSEWQTMAPYQGNFVLSLKEWNGDLYIGGSFASFSDGRTVRNVVRWNGSSFITMPFDNAFFNGVNNTVRALEVYAGQLIVGGAFTQATQLPHARIAAWNGSTWSTLGSGVDGQVNALAVYNNELIVGGAFNNAGGAPAARIARWNGSNWTAMATSTDGGFGWLAVRGNTLLATGGQSTIDGQPNRQLSAWNGSSWSQFLPTEDLPAAGTRMLRMVNGTLWVGGTFAGIGNTPSMGLVIEASGAADAVFANGFE